MKSLPYKSAFIFAQKWIGAGYRPFCIFSVVPLLGATNLAKPPKTRLAATVLVPYIPRHRKNHSPLLLFDYFDFHYTLAQ